MYGIPAAFGNLSRIALTEHEGIGILLNLRKEAEERTSKRRRHTYLIREDICTLYRTVTLPPKVSPVPEHHLPISCIPEFSMEEKVKLG